MMSFIRRQLFEKLEEEDRDTVRLEEMKTKFESLIQLESTFNKQLFWHISEADSLAKKDPGFLVKLLRIIENDEKMNESVKNHFLKQQEEVKNPLLLPVSDSGKNH